MTSEQELRLALFEATKKCGLDVKESDIVIENTKDRSHGDYATNIAMRFARISGKKPLELAKLIESNFVCDACDHMEIAGPGFLNFFMKHESLGGVVSMILNQGKDYGRGAPNGIKVDVEYVSANPTGDLHLGHTRGAALGDSTANLYAFAGYDVTREYYLNDCGNQVAHLGHSLGIRYRELFGQTDEKLGDDDYHGNDLIDIAKTIKEKYGDKYLPNNEESRQFFVRYGIDTEFGKIQKDLADFRVHFDKISYESDIRKGTRIEDTIKELEEKGYVYTKDGAKYLKTSAFLDDKDRPIVKSDGSYTYFMPDICYHYDKMSRGFSFLVDMLGADHHGYINRMKSALMMKGYSKDALHCEIYQIVRVYKNGEEVKMSKRTGKAITHRELVHDCGVDAVRYFFSEKAGTSHLDFNYDLAMSQSKDNPVYYAQYAHARCFSLLTLGSDIALDPSLQGLEGGAKESELLKQLAEFPNLVQSAASIRAPYKVAGYIQKLASLIHEYYAATKIIDRTDALGTGGRLALMKAAMIVLENSLALLGVSAPEKM